MENKTSILFVGIGGYGNYYINTLLNSDVINHVQIAGAVDIAPESCTCLPQLKELGVPIYATIEEFYTNGKADLAVICTPINLHSKQTIYALSHGSNVLCEKPVCATIQEALEMIEVRDRMKKFVAIGYQWSFSKAILELKKDILDGLLGKPKRLKTIVLWPRDFSYFNRSWAGKKRLLDGSWVLDSVANNGTAHFLHNMLFLMGKSMNQSGIPKYVQAELYRANSIENFDTSVIDVVLEEDIEIMFYASHASKGNNSMAYCFEFEKAVVKSETDDYDNQNITVLFSDGTKKLYGYPSKEVYNKLFYCIDAVNNEVEIPCGVEAAMSHTLCINGAQESMPEIQSFPNDLVMFDKEAEKIWVEGLGETLLKCYEDWEMPYNAKVHWAVSGERVDLKDYKYFSGFSKDVLT